MPGDAEVLFRPLSVRSMRLRNRIVMAPMTRSFAKNGFVGQGHADYYRRRAEGGTARARAGPRTAHSSGTSASCGSDHG